MVRIVSNEVKRTIYIFILLCSRSDPLQKSVSSVAVRLINFGVVSAAAWLGVVIIID